MFQRYFQVAAAIALLLLLVDTNANAQNVQSTASAKRVPVVFLGGHDTDPRDRGRPVILVAAALGVTPEVFREAFSHVHPASAGTQPDPEQVRQNKAALMAALSRFGVTNERLNEVSNYYRYNRQRGELWTNQPATAYAQIENGKITGFVVTNSGSGYSSPPAVKVPGFEALNAKVELSFGKILESNGSVAAIKILPEAR